MAVGEMTEEIYHKWQPWDSLQDNISLAQTVQD